MLNNVFKSAAVTLNFIYGLFREISAATHSFYLFFM